MVSLALPMITLRSSRALKPGLCLRTLDAYSSSLFLGLPEDRDQAPLGCIGALRHDEHPAIKPVLSATKASSVEATRAPTRGSASRVNSATKGGPC